MPFVSEQKTSIREKLLFIMIGLILALLTTMTLIHYTSQKALFKEELDRRIALMKDSVNIRGKTLSTNIARYTENAIAGFDFFSISQTLEKSVTEGEDLIYGILVDSSGNAHIHTQNPDLVGSKLDSPVDKFALQQTEVSTNEFKANEMPFLEFITPIVIGETSWGVLRLGFSLTALEKEIFDSRTRLNEQLKSLLIKSVSITIIFVFVGSLLIGYSSGRITRPLRHLTEFSSKLAREDFDAKISEEATSSNDEIGVLSRTFEKMAKNLKKSYEQLENYSQTLEQKVEDRTAELQKTLETLKQSQEQLVQSEKMASLGQLVAGVAHEINTPIGIGVTASTFMQEQISKLKEMLASDKIDENDLTVIMKQIDQSGDLVFSNLLRASELITSFKQTSADQTSQEKRSFDMQQVITDTMNTLRPELKKASVKANINCPEGLIINSYPGAISQVITCFVMNSIIHGFENIKKNGEIIIDIKKDQEDKIVIKYSDNGKGIPEDFQKSIFDPFVTTKRGSGGTGLGLHIAFNVVQKALNGNLSFQSTTGKGATFIISMPVEKT